MEKTVPISQTQHHESSNSDTESNGSDAAPQARATTTAPKTYRRSSRRRKHKILGLKSQAQRGNDPYDYEQKYSEDEPYKEMGPMARIWKVFLDECTKFDAEMTEDWKDALDVLLVFAGLFSAVVTTFLSQTSQNLQPDYIEFTASKMSEVADLVRVAITGRPEDVQAIPRIAEVVATFKPTRTAVWVNGLWFTSLALSLTTALLAVLTKQWIHQYASVPSGTPRDRSRIRQFRYNSLEKWRVPMIIGLLPVLMHISLGVFFAGLVVFLRSLDTVMSAVITVVAILGFMAYFGTNLLPLCKPDCPYKTSLTLYSYDISLFLWSLSKRLIRRWRKTRQSEQETPIADGNTKIALSLREVEKERVQQVAVEIDEQCISWLFNISSNSSVQRVVAQALCQVPLKSVKPISEKIPAVHEFIRTVLLLPEHRTADNNPTYERLFRALVKFSPNSPPPPITQLSPAPNSLAWLINKDHSSDAAALLREQIVDPTMKLDILSWALILRNVLRSGTDWLDAHRTDSRVWLILLSRIMGSHSCLLRDNCERKAATFCTLYTPPRQGDGRQSALQVLDLPGTELPKDFISAVSQHMSPSFYKILWDIAFPSSTLVSFPTLPPDVRLQLDIMRRPYIQEGFGYSTERGGETTMKDLIAIAQRHLDIEQNAGDTLGRHPGVVQATFPALCDVVSSEAFVSGSMTFVMKRDVLHALFRTLIEDLKLTETFNQWLTPSLLTAIRDVAFVDIPEQFPAPLITEILEYEHGAGSSRGHFVAVAYAYLSRRGWLQEIQDGMLGPLKGGPKVPFLYTQSYPFLASEYVEGLATLQRVDPSVYEETLHYLQEPLNLVILSKLLLVADSSRRQSLFKLVDVVGQTRWMACYRELQSLLRTEEGNELYRWHALHLHGKHPFRTSLALSHGSYTDLEVLLSATIRLDCIHPLAPKSTNGLNPFVRFLCFVGHWFTRNKNGESGDEEVV